VFKKGTSGDLRDQVAALQAQCHKISQVAYILGSSLWLSRTSTWWRSYAVPRCCSEHTENKKQGTVSHMHCWHWYQTKASPNCIATDVSVALSCHYLCITRFMHTWSQSV